MNTKRLLNYEFLRDMIMATDGLDDCVGMKLKKHALSACFTMSYLKFVSANTMVDGIKDNKLVVAILLQSKKHNCLVHYTVESNHTCSNATFSEEFAMFDYDDGDWKLLGSAPLKNANDLITYMSKNIPPEFILGESIEDLPICPEDYSPAEKPTGTSHIAEDKINRMIDEKISRAADCAEKWILREFCPTLQTWLEQSLGCKLDSQKKPEPLNPQEPENKSNLL